MTKRIEEQAYKLELPPHLHVHNVFHVSLLKQYIADPSHVLNHDEHNPCFAGGVSNGT